MANEIKITVREGSSKYRKEIDIEGHDECQLAIATKMVNAGWRIYLDNGDTLGSLTFRDIEFTLLNYLKGEAK